VFVLFKHLLPNKEKAEKEESGPKVQFKPWALVGALIAMGLTAFALSFLVDYKDALAYGLFAGFVVWILVSAKREEMGRVSSLIMVFFVVIFFWMSFHQNGLTLTWFARDYTVKEVGPLTNLFFTLPSLLAVVFSVLGLVLLVKKSSPGRTRIIGGALFVVAFVFAYFRVTRASSMNPIAPEVFQSFNPLFVVSLTFPVMGLFAWLNKRNIEPSTPKKIGFGMIIALLGFVVMLLSSVSLPSQTTLAGSPVPDAGRVTPYWLIGTYLILTVAELFLSPMGLSFVSKVAPSRFQGLMQGGWLLATAVGNKLLSVPGKLYDKIELWQLWLVFIACCLVAATFIFSIMKRLENATK
jgi:POT family proton-dependent oligopeptide transporter